MVLYTGATVEEAIQHGLNELDIPRMKAHITVVAREKKGFLGLFGKKPAQVEIEPIAETTVVKANQKAVKGVPDEINAHVSLQLLKKSKNKAKSFLKRLRQKSSSTTKKLVRSSKNKGMNISLKKLKSLQAKIQVLQTLALKSKKTTILKKLSQM